MSKVTLEITRGLSGKCTLLANHSLDYSGDGVDIHLLEGNEWTITAVHKGRHVVHVIKEQDGTSPGEITVMVPNTPPTLDPDVTQDTVAKLVSSAAPTTESIDPGKHFKDVDEDDDPPPPGGDTATTQGKFRFRVFQKPDEVLIRTHRGFVAVQQDTGDFTSDLKAGSIVTQAIVLKDPNPLPNTGRHGPARKYQIRLSAYDSDNDQSDSPVTLEFLVEKPEPKMYNLKKGAGTSFQRPKIGNRIAVDIRHTINLSNTAADDITDYEFLRFITTPAIEGKIKQADNTFNDTVTRDTVLCEPVSGPPESVDINDDDTDNVQGDGCWSAKISGSEVSLGTFSPGDTPPTIEFGFGADRRLTDASDVTITIAYYVIGQVDDTTTENKDELDIRSVGSKSLTLDIHRCVEFDDCP